MSTTLKNLWIINSEYTGWSHRVKSIRESLEIYRYGFEYFASK